MQANVEGEDVRARITLVEPLDEAAARIQKGLRISCASPRPCRPSAERLKGRAESEVMLVLMLAGARGEVEVRLPGKYRINPAVSNAIKSLPGVAEVELV